MPTIISENGQYTIVNEGPQYVIQAPATSMSVTGPVIQNTLVSSPVQSAVFSTTPEYVVNAQAPQLVVESSVTAHRSAMSDVDGLNAALDAKLDATDYNSANTLAQVLTVDGAGSTLDADLLDGQHGSHFLDWNNFTNLPATFPATEHNHDDRYYTEAEADSRFVNSAGDTMSGDLTVDGKLITDKIVNRTGQQIILIAGEADGKFAAQTAEHVYVNAEVGLSIHTPDSSHPNFEAGYVEKKTVITGQKIDIDGHPFYENGGTVNTLNGIRIGYNEATGGGSAASIANASNGNRFYIAPTDKAGSYDWGKELTFDPDGEAIWTAEGGFRTTGDLYVENGAIHFNDTSGSVQKITHTSSSIYLHADAHIRFFESDGNTEQFTFDLNAGNLSISNDLNVTNNIAATGAITSSNRLVCHNGGSAPYTEQLRLGRSSSADRMFRFMLHDNSAGYYDGRLTWNLRHDGTNWKQGNWGGSSQIGFESNCLRFYADDQITGGAEDTITPTEVLELSASGSIFSNRVTMNGGMIVSTNTWDDYGLRLNGNAPSVYFAQNDGAGAFIGMNGNNFYILEDENKDGAYGGSPYPFQVNVVDKVTTFGGNVSMQSGSKLYIDGTNYLTTRTGTYGNVQTGDGAGWDGYSINGQAVFMCDGSTMGLYDDINNTWGFKYTFGGAAEVRYAGATKLLTVSDGVSISGNIDLSDGGTINFGTGDDYKIWDDGSNTYHRSVRHGGDVYFQGEDSGGTVRTVFKIEDGSYLRAYHNGSERFRTESGGVRVYGDLIMNASTDYIQAREIRTAGGQQLVLAAGESSSSMSHADMGGEKIYAVGEAGLRVHSSPDNWGASGWGGRYTADICDSNGESSLPGKLTIGAGGLEMSGTDILGVAQYEGTGRLVVGADSYNGGNPGSNAPSADGDGIKLSPNALIIVQNKAADATGTAAWKNYHGTTLTMRIDIDGDMFNKNNTYGAISDVNLKENIENAQSQWEDFKSLRFVNYDFKDRREDDPRQMGVIAQEVEQVSPGLVTTDGDSGYKRVKYSVMYLKAAKALQEAQTRIEKLEEMNAAILERLESAGF